MYTNAIEPAKRVMPSATRFCRLLALIWAYARRSGWVTRWIGTGISTGFLLIRIPAHYRTSLPLRQSLGFHSRLRIGTHVSRLSSLLKPTGVAHVRRCALHRGRYYP